MRGWGTHFPGNSTQLRIFSRRVCWLWRSARRCRVFLHKLLSPRKSVAPTHVRIIADRLMNGGASGAIRNGNSCDGFRGLW
jgi:hypothetical protein